VIVSRDRTMLGDQHQRLALAETGIELVPLSMPGMVPAVATLHVEGVALVIVIIVIIIVAALLLLLLDDAVAAASRR
jgi:hypothetical protein